MKLVIAIFCFTFLGLFFISSSAPAGAVPPSLSEKISVASLSANNALTPSTIVIIVSALVALLVIILLAVFIVKRKRYLQVAHKVSGSMRPAQIVAAPVDNSPLNLPTALDLSEGSAKEVAQPAPLAKSSEASSLASVTQDAQIGTTFGVNVPESPIKTEAVISSAPDSQSSAANPIEQKTAEPTSGEIIIGYGQKVQEPSLATKILESNEATLDQAKQVATKEPPILQNNIANKEISDEPEITFDE